MATVRVESSYRRAVVLMTLTSLLIPMAGVVTAPILARALDVTGRGQLAAALAPAGLMLAAATMGLPDAVTYHVAKRPEFIRRALAWSGLITSLLALACVLVVFLALPFLRGGSLKLGHLILLAALLTVPALTIGVFRGAATGAHRWGAIVTERLILTGGRVVLFGALFATHRLTVTAAVLVNVALPIIAGAAYLGLLVGHPVPAGEADVSPSPEEARAEATVRSLVSFGSRVWFGSVASMVLDRAAPLLMVPLSDAANLGLYTVANTVSDLPLFVALAISGALFGANAKSENGEQVTATSRLTLLVCGLGCLVLVGTMPWWVSPVFGPDFSGALGPTVVLTLGSLIVIPGVMAGTALSAWGRPGLRSAGLAVTLVVSLPLFLLLVPPYGAEGAAWAEVISSVVFTGFLLQAATRVIGVRVTEFFLIRWTDVLRLWQEGERARRLVFSQAQGRHRRGSELVDSR